MVAIMIAGLIGVRMGALSISWDWMTPFGFSSAVAREKEMGSEESSAAPRVCEVRVHICGDPAEASYLEMVLEQEAIAYRREDTAMGPYGFTFVPQLGFCTLIVEKHDAEKAVTVICQALRQHEWPAG
jgi:hypothetical protein